MVEPADAIDLDRLNQELNVYAPNRILGQLPVLRRLFKTRPRVAPVAALPAAMAASAIIMCPSGVAGMTLQVRFADRNRLSAWLAVRRRPDWPDEWSSQ